MRYGEGEEGGMSPQMLVAYWLLIITFVLVFIGLTPLGDMTLPEIWQAIKVGIR